MLGSDGLICLAIIVGSILCSFFIVRLHEYITTRRAYNKGVCPKCGRKLKLDIFSGEGDRRYKCERCAHSVWINCNSTIDIEKIK